VNGHPTIAVLVPVKSFRAAKQRLASNIDAVDRERLARWMADGVVSAAGSLPVFVACNDDDVAAWAEARGAGVLWGPGLGLNGAVDHGVATIAGKGFDHVVIAHSDLPMPDRLSSVALPGTIVIVPDRRRDGTNVLARPCRAALAADYGAGSFRRHLGAAVATGMPVTVRRDARLSIDIDTVADCRHPAVAAALGATGIDVGLDIETST
jgi:2-phospho-L-lactate/phosphoenolpyruvate guanylyltransferase